MGQPLDIQENVDYKSKHLSSIIKQKLLNVFFFL